VIVGMLVVILEQGVPSNATWDPSFLVSCIKYRLIQSMQAISDLLKDVLFQPHFYPKENKIINSCCSGFHRAGLQETVFQYCKK